MSRNLEERKTGGFECLRRFAAACLCATLLTLAQQTFGVAYVTNDVYTVTSYSSPADRQQLNMYGGTVKFENTASKGFVRNVIRIDSPVDTDVAFDSSYAATPRAIDFAKDVWHSWRGYGNGSIGNLGMHIMDVAFWALDLKNPDRVTCHDAKFALDGAWDYRDAFEFHFPTSGMGEVTLHWWDGAIRVSTDKQTSTTRAIRSRMSWTSSTPSAKDARRTIRSPTAYRWRRRCAWGISPHWPVPALLWNGMDIL